MIKSTMTNKCASVAGHFHGHADALKRWTWHCPMQQIQGHTRCPGSCHLATTHYVSPQQPPGQQANKQLSTNTPKKVAVLMAMAMRRYVTAHIAQWRRSRALLEATGRCHWASIMFDNINQTWLQRFFYVFIVKTVGKSHGLTLRPLFLIGVWHIIRNRRAWLR